MILASKSPRRKEILESFDMKLEIKTADIDESSNEIKPSKQVEEIAYKKAIKIANENKKSYVLAADTVVVFENNILGKPKDEKDAYDMLKKMSGKVHEVITGYVFLNLEKKIEIISHNRTKVYMRDFDEEKINWYIATKEPMDKAGAYGIQGKGNILIDKIDGDFFNVMGFPLSKFINDLEINGISLEEIKKL
ncbi:nucleoside triphosphate pyrophosphatase [Haliovirga abyssi]|uniref:dTTP/UTP pyrophosphatase n=1 Tax=Haliovirga abyssi TaxID=2996794 RepID=A0AAU9DZF4_9FUSO|nr:Maf family protein [Haliovirga abyssi]BDU50930.1 Maf-like protein [Haliovirga abyssi]